MSNYAQMGPSGNLVKLSNGAVTPTPRSLWVGTAGTATMIDASGNTLTNFPLLAGLNPLRITNITLGTAADVWAVY
jgi:hypothetical protein